MKKADLQEKINNFLSSVFDKVEAEETPAAVELKQYTMEDGTIIEYDELEIDYPIYIVTEDGNIPVPDGELMIEGKIITVVEGMITEVKEEEVPEETPAEVPVEQEVEVKAEEEKPSEEPETMLKSEYDEKLTALEAEYNEKLKSEREKIKVELEKFMKEIKEDSKLIQAPVEDNTPSKPLTRKDIILKEIEDKLKEKNN